MSHHGQDSDEFIGQIADAVCSHGLRLPTLIGLEAGRPFSLLGSQFLWILQPLLSLLVSRESISELAELLEEPSAVEKLIDQLEAREI